MERIVARAELKEKWFSGDNSREDASHGDKCMLSIGYRLFETLKMVSRHVSTDS